MVCGLGVTGCVARSLTIRTDPPDALVYVDDVYQGASPATFDFDWYGWHRVTLHKDGFQRVEDRQLLQAPPWLWIPLDLLAEMWPGTLRDDRTWVYTLSPVQAIPLPQPPPEASDAER